MAGPLKRLAARWRTNPSATHRSACVAGLPGCMSMSRPRPAARASTGRAPRSGHGCCWLRVASPQPPAGPRSEASPLATSRHISGSGSIRCWRGWCSPRTAPPRQSPCWSGCTRRRPPRTGPAASSRPRRCGRWLWLPAARRPARRTSWPGAHPRLPAGLCPSVRRRGSAGGRAAGPTGRGPEDSTGRRARRLSTLSGPALAGLRPGADRPGAGDPSTASGAHAQPADRPRAGGQPRYGQKARQPPAGQARRGQRTEAVTRARSSA